MKLIKFILFALNLIYNSNEIFRTAITLKIKFPYFPSKDLKMNLLLLIWMEKKETGKLLDNQVS